MRPDKQAKGAFVSEGALHIWWR